MGPPGGNNRVVPPDDFYDNQHRIDARPSNFSETIPPRQDYAPASNELFARPETTIRGRNSPTPAVENEELPAQETNTDITDNARPLDTPDGRAGGARSRVNVNVSYNRHSSTRNEVSEATPDYFTSFIVDRMRDDGIDIPPELNGRNARVKSEIALTLRKIGDDISNNQNLNHMIKSIKVTRTTAYKTFVSVAAQIFQDGTINWGRIVTLFYFAYKLAIQVINDLPLIDIIIHWVSTFVGERLAAWISERGGWGSIREYFGSTSGQMIGVFLAGIALSTLFWRWNRK